MPCPRCFWTTRRRNEDGLAACGRMKTAFGLMKSAAAQPYEAASLMKSACGLMKPGFALIAEFCNLPIAK